MGLFGVSLLEARRMTKYEFEMNLIAYSVKRQKEMEMASYQAWQTNQAKAVKQVGAGKNMKTKPYFKDFNSFYNSKKEFESLFDTNLKNRKRITLADLNRQLNINAKKGG